MTKLVRQEQTAERGMVREPDRWTDRQLTEEWIDRQTESTLRTLPSPSSR